MRIIQRLEDIVMQPDHLFGPTVIIGCGGTVGPGVAGYFISQFGFPEAAMVWEMNIFNAGADGLFSSIAISTGDDVPTTDTEFSALPKLIPQAPFQQANLATFLVGTSAPLRLSRMRMVARTGSRKLIIRVQNFGAAPQSVTVTMSYASIPRRIVLT